MLDAAERYKPVITPQLQRDINLLLASWKRGETGRAEYDKLLAGVNQAETMAARQLLKNLRDWNLDTMGFAGKIPVFQWPVTTAEVMPAPGKRGAVARPTRLSRQQVAYIGSLVLLILCLAYVLHCAGVLPPQLVSGAQQGLDDRILESAALVVGTAGVVVAAKKRK